MRERTALDRWDNKKVLITGATGLIGSNLTKSLLHQGAEVIAMGRNASRLRDVFIDELHDDKFSYVIGNIANGIPAGIGKVDYLFHAASPISGQEIKERPLDTISANLDGLIHCLEYLRKEKCGRMVVFSSATVYGNAVNEDVQVSEDDTDQAECLHKDNAAYSESKRMTEVIARAYRKQYQVDSVIARMGYVYGYTRFMPNTAFYEFIGKAMRGEDIILNHAGMARRDNIHVDDVVNGLLILAMHGKSGEAYNLSSDGELGNYCAIDEIAGTISEVAAVVEGKKVVQVHVPSDGKKRLPGVRLKNEKVKGLGWKMTMSMEKGIADIFKRMKAVH